MKRTFVMNGKTYNSMMDIARELGVKRVYPRDFSKLGIIETTGSDDVAEVADVADVAEETVADVADVADVAEETVADVAEETVADVAEETPKKSGTGTPDEIKKAQDSVSSATLEEFNNTIRHFNLEALVTMAEEAGVKTWDTITNAPIRKMRLLMELKGHYYPGQKLPVKVGSVWHKLTLEQLMELADENNLDYKKIEDKKIQRMWVTMALNKSGLKPEDYKQEDSANA